MKNIKLKFFLIVLIAFIYSMVLSGSVLAANTSIDGGGSYGDNPVEVTPGAGLPTGAITPGVTPPGPLTDASCLDYCYSSGTCHSEAYCNAEDPYGTDLCVQNGCVGKAIDNGWACSCSNWGCHASSCWTGWSLSCPAGQTCEAKPPCTCGNGVTCYKPLPSPMVTGIINCDRCSPTQDGVYESWSTTDLDCTNFNPMDGSYVSIPNVRSCYKYACYSDPNIGIVCPSDGTSCTQDICLNPGTASATCSYPTIAPNCSDAANHCQGQTYTPANGCGTCVGTALPTGTWSAWSTCSSCTQSRTCNSVCGGTCAGPTTQSCGFSNGSSGSCGSADGALLPDVPASGLCSVGSSSSVTTTGRNLGWTCYGTSGTCGGSGGSSVSCSAVLNRTPVFETIAVENSSDTIVPSDDIGGGRLGNHICQTQLASDRIVKFVVTASDPDDINDIKSIQIKMGTTIYSPISSGSGTATFAIQYPADEPMSMNKIYVNITDIYDATTDWVDTLHDFKVWDCKVPVVGTIFDGSNGEVCSTTNGYTKPINSSVGYNLSYRLGGLAPRDMTVNSPDYSSNGNSLVWGTSYIPYLTNFPGADPTQLRLTDLTNSKVSCVTQLDLTRDYVWPYSDAPSIRVDFASVMDQLPWFQASGGGVVSKTSITDSVPITCVTGGTCEPAIVIGNSVNNINNGVVAAPSVNSNSGCSADCKYGSPNNWYTNANLLQESYDYKYFYDEYFVKLGQGITLPGGVNMATLKTAIAGVGGTGIVFVNGDLAVNQNLSLTSSQYLMVIVKGDINVDQSVDRLDGVYVATNIRAGDVSDNRLVINGVIYATNSVSFDRGFATKSKNNDQPAVIVNYRPELIFSMPGKLVKIISGWKGGI